MESPERLQKLDRLSEEVQTNKYQVDIEALSNRLVENAIRPKT